MSKLSRRAVAAHREASRLVELRRDLDEDEKQFVLTHWQESANLEHASHGAFFTPLPLARAMTLHVFGTRIIDLAAGIGHLAFACRNLFGQRHNGEPAPELVCVERNPDLVRVGMKVLPEAVWVCDDLLNIPARRMRGFDTAIANPPYGRIARSANAFGYNGFRFEYHTIAVAAQIARHGVFLIPQAAAPFRYSGERHIVTGTGDDEYERFSTSTGITLEPSNGIDTTFFRSAWHQRPPDIEVVVCDFTDPTVLGARRWPARDTGFDSPRCPLFTLESRTSPRRLP
ncbi:methyltransferase [Nocardia transvalensis]|uniref:methyltransferase n=1 Tax=Nocardia transvalensis TaxID=37333 RepID=UPI0018955E06|nr:methyltransferase [Nocardia transvalensis]MBF6328432.1 methyltransferase [Nocardia transvalensis]